jgi:minor extracellular serine protease Vpr
VKRAAAVCLLLALLLAAAASARAESSKLDPRTRAAAGAIRAGASVAQLRASRTSVSDAGALDVFITGTASRAELEAMGVTVRTFLPGVCTAFVPVGALDQLEQRADVSAIHAAVLCEATNDSGTVLTGATIERGAGPAFVGINGAGVLVGDVDSGIDVHHADFQDSTGSSRILYVWDQNNTSSVSPPTGFTYGHEWTKASIDAALCTEVDAGTTGGHGSHVMGTIAGNGSKSTATRFQYAGMAPMADIAMVATTFYNTAILDGVNWIFQRATALGKNAVVNLSLGNQYGPHDGSDAFEAGIDALCGPGRIVCVSAGNEGGSNIHAGMSVPAAGDSMKFTITMGSLSGHGCEFNGWYDAPDNMTISLRTPGGFIITLAAGASYGALSATTGWPTSSTGVNGKVYMENGVTHGANGVRLVYLLLQSGGSGTGDLSGTWTLRCTPTLQAGSTTRIDVWRDWRSTSSLNVAFSLKNSNDHLVAEPACARQAITVGAYQSRYNWFPCSGGSNYYTNASQANSGKICAFSNPGPTRDGRQKPDIVAPGSAIISTLSADLGLVCNSWTTPDGVAHQPMQGTSMAAPHVAGAVALLLQRLGALTPDQVKAYLAANATIDANTGAPWNATYGNGKLHLPDLVVPACAVVSPAGGERWIGNSSHSVTWTASDNVAVTSVNVDYSLHGSAGPWVPIAAGAANSGAVAWTLPGAATDSGLVRVTASDAAGNSTAARSPAFFHITSSVGVSPLPAGRLWLGAPAPNPSYGGVALRFTLPQDGRAAVDVFGVNGERVWSRAWTNLAAGDHSIAWDGATSAHQHAAAGLYFVRLTTDAGERRTRLVRVQ